MAKSSPDYRFGYKIAWLAVRTEDPARLLKSLPIKSTEPVAWEEGIRLAYHEKGAFVSSPVQGWIFVVDRDLMSAVDHGHGILSTDLCRLSRDFGEAQYFLNYRVSSVHGWVRARQGKIERAWVSADGEQVWEEGPISKEEMTLDLAYGTRPASPEMKEKHGNDEDLYVPGEEDVVNMAGAWSINPETLSAKIVTNPTGLLLKPKSRAFEVGSDFFTQRS